jgi:hypothetical protein
MARSSILDFITNNYGNIFEKSGKWVPLKRGTNIELSSKTKGCMI